MNALIDTPKHARHKAGVIVLEMTGGEVIHFPVERSALMKGASA